VLPGTIQRPRHAVPELPCLENWADWNDSSLPLPELDTGTRSVQNDPRPPGVVQGVVPLRYCHETVGSLHASVSG